MAALLKFGTAAEVLTTAETIARLNAAATLRRPVCVRPKLACHWQLDAEGRPFCRWDIEAPDIPSPKLGRHPAHPVRPWS